LWWFWLSRGYLSEGRRWLQQALEAAAAVSITGTPVATALNNAAVLAATAGAYGEAADLFVQSLAIHQELGDERGSAATLNNLGNVAMQQHDYDRADDFYSRALTIFRAIGDASNVARVLGNLGELARLRGDGERAAEWAAESLALYTRLQDTAGVAQVLHTLGGAALLRGDLDAAATAYGEAADTFRRLGSIVDTAGSLEGLAVVATRRGLLGRAATLFAAAAALREASDAPTPPADRGINNDALNLVRSGLSPERFAAAWAAGRDLSLEQAAGMASDNAPARPAGEIIRPDDDSVVLPGCRMAERDPHGRLPELSGRKTG